MGKAGISDAGGWYVLQYRYAELHFDFTGSLSVTEKKMEGNIYITSLPADNAGMLCISGKCLYSLCTSGNGSAACQSGMDIDLCRQAG